MVYEYFRNKNIIEKEKYAPPKALNVVMFGYICTTSRYSVQLWYIFNTIIPKNQYAYKTSLWGTHMSSYLSEMLINKLPM